MEKETDKQIGMSYGELTSKFRTVERKGEHLLGYVVFTVDSFDKPYDELSRTYCVSSNNKAFQPNMGCYSIYALYRSHGSSGRLHGRRTRRQEWLESGTVLCDGERSGQGGAPVQERTEPRAVGFLFRRCQCSTQGRTEVQYTSKHRLCDTTRQLVRGDP